MRLLNGACPSARICDFEDASICGYENDVTANFGWLRHAGSTPTSTSGATSGQSSTKRKTSHFLLTLFYLDHTYGTGVGHYMFIEASFPQKENDKARLISPEYTVTPGGSCLQFFYHMWGQTTGALNVFLKEGEIIQSPPLWSLKGDQGNLWRSASATIKSTGKYRVDILENCLYETVLSLFSRSCSKASLALALTAIYRSMIFRFHLVHVQHTVHVHSNKIYAVGHHQTKKTISIGIVYHPNKLVYCTMVQIILLLIRQ